MKYSIHSYIQIFGIWRCLASQNYIYNFNYNLLGNLQRQPPSIYIIINIYEHDNQNIFLFVKINRSQVMGHIHSSASISTKVRGVRYYYKCHNERDQCLHSHQSNLPQFLNIILTSFFESVNQMSKEVNFIPCILFRRLKVQIP